MAKTISATVDDAKRLFHHSYGFFKAEQHLIRIACCEMGATAGDVDKDDIRKMSILIPPVVLSAIQLEFLLKILLILDKGEYPAIHEFDDLFDELAQKTKDRLRLHYDKISAGDNSISAVEPTVDKSIEAVLKRSSDAFTKFRYFPSAKFAGLEGFTASDVTHAAMIIISEDHPDWLVP